jgi:hypothetical protein
MNKDRRTYSKIEDEPKVRVNVMLSEAAIARLDAQARNDHTTRSAILERLARDLRLDVMPTEAVLLGELLPNCSVKSVSGWCV